MEILVTVETDRFEHQVVKPQFINSCCFGEDFAVWLTKQLSPPANAGFVFSEPIQEDWGWGFWASRQNDRFWVALSYVGEGPQQEPAQWAIAANYEPGLNLFARLFHKVDQNALAQLREQILQAVKSDGEIKIVPNPESVLG
jgi:hypothetical protein